MDNFRFDTWRHFSIIKAHQKAIVRLQTTTDRIYEFLTFIYRTTKDKINWLNLHSHKIFSNSYDKKNYTIVSMNVSRIKKFSYR